MSFPKTCGTPARARAGHRREVLGRGGVINLDGHLSRAMSDTPDPQLSTAQLADISALADGSLPPGRRDAVQGLIAGSPAARQLYERERAVVRVLQRTAAQERAPVALRARIDDERRSGSRGRPSSRRWIAGFAVAGVAVLALVLALVGSTTPGPPTVPSVVALASRGPAAPPPAESAAAPRRLLDARVGTVYFPNYQASRSFVAIGQRTDRIADRLAVTVFYERDGARVAYSIVSGPPLSEPAWSGGYRSLVLGRRIVVTWRRGGHTCVLSATGVSDRVLLTLAQYEPV